MSLTIEDAMKLDIIRHEKVWIINKGMSDELVVAASDINEACELFLRKRRTNATSVEKVYNDIVMAAI